MQLSPSEQSASSSHAGRRQACSSTVALSHSISAHAASSEHFPGAAHSVCSQLLQAASTPGSG
jgi:hypothetical protein